MFIDISGESCRSRVLKNLQKEFDSLSRAEEHFNIDYFAEDPLLNVGPLGSVTSTPRSAHPLSIDVVVNSLSPLFFSPSHGKSALERDDH